MKNIYFLCLLSCTLFSQEKEKKHAIAINPGTGLGLDYSYKFNNYISVTTRYSLLPYVHTTFDYVVSGVDLHVKSDLEFTHIDLLGNIALFGKSIKLIVGGGYFFNNDVNVDISFNQNVTIGNIVLTSDQLGDVLFKTNWDRVLPFLGIGFGRSVPRTGFGIGFELGVFYDYDGPQVTLVADNLFENTEFQELLLENFLRDENILPYASLRVAYSF